VSRMQPDEFQFQMRRLMAFYGKKLSGEQLDIWFEKCGNLDAFHFRKAISDVISEERTFPTPSQLIKLAAFSVEKNPRPEDKKRAACANCGSGGWIHTQKETPEGVLSYAFRCPCENGQRLSGKIRTWGSQYASDGYQRLK